MKARLLAVLSISMLVLASVAPAALAQATDSRNDNARVQYVDCSQVQAAVGSQYGGANAANEAHQATVANKLNISQSQVNACLGEIGGLSDGDGDGDGGNDGPRDAGEDADAADIDEGKDAVIADTIPEADELPNTGGPSLLALGAGLALVAGGALIRFRR